MLRMSFILICILFVSGSCFAQVTEKSVPDRNQQLQEFLPVMQMLYESTSRHGYKDWPDADAFISIETLEDLDEVIKFTRGRYFSGGGFYNDGRHPFPVFNYGFALWPDTVSFVMESGLRGCLDICRALLLHGHAKKVIIIETEPDPELPPSAPPRKIRATEYRLDDGRCDQPDFQEEIWDPSADRNLNLRIGRGPYASSLFGLCFTHKSIDIPEIGVFIYFNSASPLWPEPFERTRLKTEFVPDPLRSVERITPPRAFMDLSTKFSVWARHIAVENRQKGRDPIVALLFDTGCVKPDYRLPRLGLSLLNETHPPARPNFPQHLDPANTKGFCYGRKNEPGGPFPSEYLKITPWTLFSDIEIAAKLKNFHEALNKGHTDRKVEILLNEIPFDLSGMESQIVIDAIIPILKDLIIKHDKDWALRKFRTIPEVRLKGHKKNVVAIEKHVRNKKLKK